MSKVKAKPSNSDIEPPINDIKTAIQKREVFKRRLMSFTDFVNKIKDNAINETIVLELESRIENQNSL